ncbi:MAG: LacI family DNA-binding transcriptional regulator [Anaerolineae bacterium]|nr:LacI family DNA-binding transcriptional regulator [Anaerolineae bacterium]
MTTIRDVAEAAQVSTSTVSHVINGTRYVSPDTRQRVLQAMADLSYSPNRLARSLRSSQSMTLGVLLPNSANPYFAEILLGIEAACFDRGYNIILGNANDDRDRELAYLEVLISRQVDGILLISTGAYNESIALLAAHGKPVVMVDRSANSPAVDELFTANKEGGLLATSYLLGLGHRRIGCITGPSFLTPSADRVTGYFEALRGAGLPIDRTLVVTGDFQHESGYRACRQLLALAAPPTAVFACNDLMAVGALCAIHEAGLHVPDDISVVGYDDIPLASYTVPRLTTIAQPAQELGRLAVERLVTRLQKSDDTPPVQEALPVVLVERDSCRRLA